MYSPTTRLLTLLELLQSYKQMSGTEIARRLEVDVRTVRRYIVNLQDMGIPVETERGPYGAYQLQRGFKLPPMMFTDAEAVALTMGLLAIREFQFPVDVAAVEGALAKTERVMPERLLNQIRGLQEAITFNVGLPPLLIRNDFLVTLSSSVRQRQQVRLRYQSYTGDESEREFDPYGIVFNEGYWYTTGYCHLRQDLRTFRLDRIVVLEPLEYAFERPAEFDALQHVISSLGSIPSPRPAKILLKTTLENAQQIIPQSFGALEAIDEGVMLSPSAHNIPWTAHLLLHLDFPIVVLESDELRAHLRDIAAKALQMSGESEK
jgi:predicted DNA-binding transcriptional regulator YafY